MYNLEATIEKIEAQVTDDASRQALLTALKARLVEMQQSDAAAGIARLTNEIFADSGDSGESALQPQALPAETELRQTETDSPPSETCDPTEVPENAKNFAAALDKLDPALRETAAELYEHLHYKSKFARLTSIERDAIVQLLRYRTCEEVSKIIAQPPPIGMNLRTSKAGVVRFREDYLQCALQERKRKSAAEAEAQRVADDAAFAKVNATDHAFHQTTVQQIRKRLFQAVHDPQADYHEIRWLIKSLDMLRRAQPTSANPA